MPRPPPNSISMLQQIATCIAKADGGDISADGPDIVASRSRRSGRLQDRLKP